MKIQLTRIDSAFHFEATNETNNKVYIDASESIGGGGKGARPMELLIMGLGSCSGIDVLTILKKQRQEVSHFSISLDAERDTGKDANLFTKIHIHFDIQGYVDREKLQTAIHLSLDKYCSVAKTLEKTAVITNSFSVNGTKYDE
jgi:putative redox protein